MKTPKALAVSLLLMLLTSVAFAGGADPVPEIDAGAASAAIALVGGVVLTIRSRRRRQ